MSDVDNDKRITELRFLLLAMKKKKPEKPLRKRIAKKYRELHNHYLSLIEDVNQQRKIMTLAFEIVILETQTIQELIEVNSENVWLKEQVKEQRIANLKVYHLFK